MGGGGGSARIQTWRGDSMASSGSEAASCPDLAVQGAGQNCARANLDLPVDALPTAIQLATSAQNISGAKLAVRLKFSSLPNK